MNEPTKKKFNPDWPSAKADTKERKKKSQQDRRAKLHAIAVSLGFETWYKAETAIASGAIKLVKTDKA